MDRNANVDCEALGRLVSLSARRAWIEMQGGWLSHGEFPVALRKESVDRNLPYGLLSMLTSVALRKESVDRNRPVAGFRITLGGSLSARRAWIEMASTTTISICIALSLSARRAWIEIDFAGSAWVPDLSLSARRAWIEISKYSIGCTRSPVALRKESVDRNGDSPRSGLHV